MDRIHVQHSGEIGLERTTSMCGWKNPEYYQMKIKLKQDAEQQGQCRRMRGELTPESYRPTGKREKQ